MLIRKYQVLGDLETVEGTQATLTSADYVYALDPAAAESQEFDERQTSGASLSNDISTPGRSSFQFPFGLDLLPSGESTTPPDIGRYLRACGMQELTMSQTQTTGAVTGAMYGGQTVSDGGGGSALLVKMDAANNKIYYINPINGFPNDTAASTPGGGAVTLANTTISADGVYYAPDSQPTATINIGAGPSEWTGSDPTANTVLTNSVNGPLAKRALFLSQATVGGDEILTVIPILGSFDDGDTITNDQAGTATVEAGTTQSLDRVPSMSLLSNIDGWHRTGLGCRGTFVVQLEAGKTGRVNFDFSGALGSHGDTPLLTGVTPPAASALSRWQSAIAHVDGYAFPLSKMSLDMGNTVALIPDAHGPNGYAGSIINGRNPVATIDPDHQYAGVYDFITKMQNATAVAIYTELGTVAANRFAFLVPSGQITSRADGDREGLLTSDLSVAMRRMSGDGDDEFYIFMF